MFIPQFWAKKTLFYPRKKKDNSSQVGHALSHDETLMLEANKLKNHYFTISRWGWSDISQDLAEKHALERCDESYTSLISNASQNKKGKIIFGFFRKTEKNSDYIDTNLPGDQGAPIREEILEKDDNTFITRNSYGSQILNSDHLLILDVDDLSYWHQKGSNPIYFYTYIILSFLISFTIIENMRDCACNPPPMWMELLTGFMVAIFVFVVVAGISSFLIHKFNLMKKFYGDGLSHAKSILEKRQKNGISEKWRIYKTPKGARLIALHTEVTFDPHSQRNLSEDGEIKMLAVDIYDDLQKDGLMIDPLYKMLSLQQQCSRARVTAKSWNIGLPRMNKYYWPVINPQDIQDRQQWISDYEAKQVDYAACRFVENIGSASIHPEVARTVELHDRLCQAQTDKPLG